MPKSTYARHSVLSVAKIFTLNTCGKKMDWQHTENHQSLDRWGKKVQQEEERFIAEGKL